MSIPRCGLLRSLILVICGITVVPGVASAQPAAQDYAEFKAALAATAIVRYEYGASLTARPRMLAVPIALQRVAAANPNITDAQLNAFVLAYDARLRAAIPGDPNLARGINLMVAVRFPSVDLAPLPADILDGIDTEIDQQVLHDLGLDPYDTGNRDRSKQMETFQLTSVGALDDSDVVARSLQALFRGKDAGGYFHSGLVPAAVAYLATQPTFDSTAQTPATINPFPTPAVLLSRYPALDKALKRLPPTPEAFAAEAANSEMGNVTKDVMDEIRGVRTFVDEKQAQLRGQLAQGYSSLTATRRASQDAASIQNAFNQRQADLRAIADRRAAIDVGTLAILEAKLPAIKSPYQLQKFAAVYSQFAKEGPSRSLLQNYYSAYVTGYLPIVLEAVKQRYSPDPKAMISGVGQIVGCFVDEPHDIPVLGELFAMADQMSAFEQDMTNRLEHIDRAIQQAYRGLSEQLGEISLQVQDLKYDLSTVQNALAQQSSGLARFEENVYGVLEDGFNKKFIDAASLALGYRVDEGNDLFYTGVGDFVYQSFENTFIGYALTESSNLIHAGSPVKSPLTLDDLTMSGDPIGHQINLLRTVPSIFGLPNLDGQDQAVANPTSWAVNADAFLQLQRENPWYAAASSTDPACGTTPDAEWAQVLSKGHNVQNMMWAAKDQALFDALFDQYGADMNALQNQLLDRTGWTAPAGCDANAPDFWTGNDRICQADYLEWVVIQLGTKGTTMKKLADAATRHIRLIDAYLALACPDSLQSNELLRGMLRGDELGMDTAAIARYLSDQAGFLRTPGARPLPAAPSLLNGFARTDPTPEFADTNTFGLGTATPYDTGQTPIAVVIGDLNNDRWPDLVTVNPDGASISVRIASGMGAFHGRGDLQFFSGLARPVSLAIADVNRDGNLDVLVGGLFLRDFIFPDPGVVVALVNGGGGFSYSPPASTGTSLPGLPDSVAVGDLNGDGLTDLVTPNSTNNASVLLGNGNGTFQTAVSYAVGTNPTSVALGDFDGDGRPDLAVTNRGSNNVSVLLQTVTRTFVPAPNSPVASGGTSTADVSTGDLDGDGRLDLAVANGTSNNVSVLLGTGTGGFGDPTNIVVGTIPSFVAIRDINRDGRPDLAVTNFGSNNVSVLLRTATGTFTPAIGSPVAVGNSPNFLAIGDLNGDDQLDLAVTNWNSNSLSVILGVSPGARLDVGAWSHSVAIGDLNGDGQSDLAVASYLGGKVTVFLAQTTGPRFGAPNEYAVAGNPFTVAIGDLNGDGVPDLATANYSNNNVSVLLGNGNGTFQSQSPELSFAVGNNPRSVAIGDINGDGRPDLAVANGNSNNVSVLLALPNEGAPSFRAKVDYFVGSLPWFVVIGDLNGDDVPDLATANFGSNNITVLLGNGNGTFQPAANYPAGNNPGYIAIGDLNGDGLPDLATANYGGGDVSVLTGTSTGSFGGPAHYAAGNGPICVAIGDLNGDGRSDLAVAKFGSNDVSIILGELNRGKDLRDLVNAVITMPAISRLVGNGSVATATTATPHLFRGGDMVTISGASPAGFNGTFPITDDSPTQLSYPCAASGIATGANIQATRPEESYPFMQWTLAGLRHLQNGNLGSTARRTAHADQYLVGKNSALTVTGDTGLLANDARAPEPFGLTRCIEAGQLFVPPDDCPQTVPHTPPGFVGTLSPIGIDGDFGYTPPANYTGAVKFQYLARAALNPPVTPCQGGVVNNEEPQNSDAAWVSIVVLNSNDCLPAIDQQPLDAAFVAGGDASFLVRASCPAGRITFEWQRAGVPVVDRKGATPTESTITGATSSFLTISNMQSADQGSYTCKVSSGCGSVTSSTADSGEPSPQFLRGDSNGDGKMNISDASSTLTYLFLDATKAPACIDAADANDDGDVNITDAIYSLGGLFLGGTLPPAPFPACGGDPTADPLGCAGKPSCP